MNLKKEYRVDRRLNSFISKLDIKSIFYKLGLKGLIMTIHIGFAADLGIDRSQIMGFYKEHWVRKIALSDEFFHRWQFEEAPYNLGVNSCVLAVKNDQILGVMGLNRRSFNLSGNIKSGAELTTWVVDRNIRGSSSGAKILNFITNNFEFLVGMGITQDALPIYLRLKFRYLRYIPRYIYIINAKKILSISQHNSFAFKLLKPISLQKHDVKYEQIFWHEVKESPNVGGNHFSRTIKDMIWRYDEHPYFNYLSFKTYTNKSNVGYVVLRSEITNKAKILHVIDILGNEESYEFSIQFIETYAKINDYWAIDMFSTYAPLNKYFNQRGWLSAVDASFINIPYLFHPLEVRKPATTSMIYWSRHNETSFYNVSDLYISKQDADLDRPTMDYIKAKK